MALIRRAPPCTRQESAARLFETVGLVGGGEGGATGRDRCSAQEVTGRHLEDSKNMA